MIRIAGFVELSLVDIINEPCFVIWLPYCNFACPWCFNVNVVKGKNLISLKERDLKNLLKKVRDFVEFVHVSGGEPTTNKDLLKILRIARNLGFKCSISTNGSMPSVLKDLINERLLDHIAIDIKAPLDEKIYSKVIGKRGFVEKVKESVEIVTNNLDFVEIRTTYIPALLTEKDILKIAEFVKDTNAIYVIQQFIKNSLLDPNFDSRVPSCDELIEIAKKVAELELKVYIRCRELGVLSQF